MAALSRRGSADEEDPPPPPPPKAGAEAARDAAVKGTESPAFPAGARKPWAKPVLSMLHEVTSIGSGTKQPSAQSYEGRIDPAAGQFAPATPYSTYGPFQNI